MTYWSDAFFICRFANHLTWLKSESKRSDHSLFSIDSVWVFSIDKVWVFSIDKVLLRFTPHNHFYGSFLSQVRVNLLIFLVYLYDPFVGKKHPHRLVIEIKNQLAKNFVIQQANGCYSGRQCLRYALEFATIVLSNNNNTNASRHYRYN